MEWNGPLGRRIFSTSATEVGYPRVRSRGETEGNRGGGQGKARLFRPGPSGRLKRYCGGPLLGIQPPATANASDVDANTKHRERERKQERETQERQEPRGASLVCNKEGPGVGGLVVDFHVLQVPGRAQALVVVADLQLCKLSDVRGLDQELVPLASLHIVGACSSRERFNARGRQDLLAHL